MNIRRLMSMVLFGAALGLTAVSADAAPDPTVHVLSGQDRYETAALIAQEQFPNQASDVFLATGENFADALAVGPVAAGGAPVLLTARDRLPDATRRELERLRPEAIIVVGGPAAISDDVYREASAFAAQTFEVAGATRYDTAVALSAVFDDPFAVYLASGVSFPDALSGGALAGVFGEPVLLVPPRGPAPEVVRQRICELRPEVVVVLGGRSAVSEQTAQDAAACADRVERIEGPDRFATSAAISVDNEYADTVVVATGRNFPDGLAGSGLAAVRGGPLLLVERDEIPTSVGCEIRRLEPERIVVLGGAGAVGPEVLGALQRRDLPGPSACPPDRTVTRPIRMPGLEPGDAVLSGDGTTAWVVDADQVVGFDLDRREVGQTLELGRVLELAELSDGRLAATDAIERQAVRIVDPTGEGDPVQVDLSEAMEDGEVTFGISELLDGRLVVSTVTSDDRGRLLTVDLTPPEDDDGGLPLPLPQEDPPSPVVAEDQEIEPATALTPVTNSGTVLGVAGRGTGQVLVFDPSSEGDARIALVTTVGSGNSLAVDGAGDTWLLDGDLLVRDGGSRSDRLALGEVFGPADGAGAVSSDGRTVWTRGGPALVTVNAAGGTEPIEATYVPRVDDPNDPGPRIGRLHTMVSPDGTRAALVEKGVVWVIDGLDQELDRGIEGRTATTSTRAARSELVHGRVRTLTITTGTIRR